MLRRLYIKNLVLISSCELLFQEGFTVLTGESGAGKSVVLSALSLILGQKVQSTQIRQGEEQAVVEASFDELPDSVYHELQEAGISYDEADELVIRRQLSQSGKSKTFVNNQAATSSFLKKIAPYLVRFSGQHAHIALFDQDTQLHIVDTYAGILHEKKTYQKTLRALYAVEQEIEAIQKKNIHLLVDALIQEIDEIEGAHLAPGEDEALFSEYTQHATLQTLASELHELYETFDTKILQAILEKKASFDRLVKAESSAESLHTLYTTLTSDCKEICYELASWVKKTEVDDVRLYEIEQRLSLIETLKKTYKCQSIEQLMLALKAKKSEVATCSTQDVALDKLKQKNELLEQEVHGYAKILTEKRKIAACSLSKKVSHELQALKMPHAHFEIVLTPSAQAKNGDETVTFYLAANKGFEKTRLSDTASGGELSRIFLALTCALIEQQESCFLVFDEIDANVGGKTAAVIGDKLKVLGEKHQVLAITHFPQVAKYADHHFLLTKEEQNNTTYTHIAPLVDAAAQNNEYVRMVGGRAFYKTPA